MPRPQITLKLATSLDGKIALANGQSEWITGEASRAQGRKLRARHDGIAVGANTAVLDNPQLTTRIAGEPDPQRIIFDSRLRLPVESNLVKTAAQIPTLILYDGTMNVEGYSLANTDVTLLPIKKDARGLDVVDAMAVLHGRGIKRLLVEGGGTLAASFIAAGFIDVIEWFRAPIILGGDGRNGIGPLRLETLDLARRYDRVELRELGDDIYERYQRLDGSSA
ncbi:RibD family protein [Fretibacter rubidus]|uniref:RibD family protein n=1 Tax=Fretibacter rubidus TaxID=570162 RepID=UPI00352A197B